MDKYAGRGLRFGDRALKDGRSVRGTSRTKVSSTKGSGTFRPLGRNNPPEDRELVSAGLLWKVLAVCVVLMVLILAISVAMELLRKGPDDKGGTEHILQTFRDGSFRAMVNSSYDGSVAYIELPAGCEIEKAILRVRGDMPPQKMAFQAGGNPSCVAASDMDGDIYPDAVVLNNRDNTIMFLKNVGGERLQRMHTAKVGLSPIKLLCADLSNDGYADSVVLCEDTKDIHVLINDRYGAFLKLQAPISFPANPSDIALLDLDGDNDTDLAVSTLNDDRVNLLSNDGTGVLSHAGNFSAQGNPTRMAPIDLDGNGLTDLVVSSRQDSDSYMYDPNTGGQVRWFNTLSFFENRGGLDFVRELEDALAQKGVSDIAVSDLNSDGDDDIVMANLGYGNISLLLSDGNGDFVRGQRSGLDVSELVSLDPNNVKIVDLDGDTHKDILTLSRSADSLLVYRGKGEGRFSPYEQYFVGANPTAMDLLDHDLDGDLDITTSDWKGFDRLHGTNGTVSLLTNLRDGIFGTYRVFPTGTSPRGVFTHDIDGDGDIDISSANYFGSTVSVLKNSGTGSFLPGVEYNIGLEPYAVVMGDFDGDGNMDGASADEANYRLVILRSDGEGGFTTERFLYDIGAWPYSLRTMDIDKDGDIDLYTSNYFQSSVTILYNGGGSDFSGIFERKTVVYLGSDMPYDSIMADVNRDGLNDLITVNRGDNIDPTATISVMLNDGSYRFDEKVSYKVGREPTSGVLFDMDDDSDLDLATSNNADGSVTVLMNNGEGVYNWIGDYLVGGRPQYVNAFDRDEDGLEDLVCTCTDTNELVFLRNTGGGGFLKDLTLSSGSFPYAIDIDDLDGDGRRDLTISSVNTNNVVVMGCTGYPWNVSIYAGDGTEPQAYLPGPVTEQSGTEIDITDALRDYVSEQKGTDGKVMVPIKVVAQKQGVVVLSDLSVLYFE